MRTIRQIKPELDPYMCALTKKTGRVWTFRYLPIECNKYPRF